MSPGAAAGPAGPAAPAVRAVRGATTVAEDTPRHIAAATRGLVTELLVRNGLEREAVISLLFTCSPDLTSDTPALALREEGWEVPALCAADTAWAGAPARTVRVLAHVTSYGPLAPVYLGDSAPTRPA
ncbi:MULTISPECIES: chorismate mutase [Streptomyces]|uniref:chorismate mutase n=1 Tax=Streptomyces TaxID=1883 RepID=UPI0007C4D5D5|nr:chorismate mutase [Streptomyces sp. NRRL S-237]